MLQSYSHFWLSFAIVCWTLLLIAVALVIRHFERKQRLTQELEEQKHIIEPSEETMFIGKFKQYIEDNIENGALSIKDICQYMDIGRSLLFNKCKKYLGLTPIEYVRKSRFERAALLLSESDKQISEVAYKSGFNDTHYFSNAFKEYYKVSPREYRSTHQNINSRDN